MEFRNSSRPSISPRDRTHVIKGSGTFQLPKQVRLSVNFIWQSGEPRDPAYRTSRLVTQGPPYIWEPYLVRPLGRSSVRLPPEKKIDMEFSRTFNVKTANLEAKLSIFNVTNELNAVGGIGFFETRSGMDPRYDPPLRPIVIPTAIDYGRSVELGLRVTF